MGLINVPKPDTVTHDRMLRFWSLPAVLGICSLLAEFAGEKGRELLSWQRAAIGDGEVWRVVSGHFVHMGWSHFALNLAGLILVWLLVGDRFRRRNWIVIIVVTVIASGVCFWFLDPALEWYVGMSGLLHGLLMAGVVMGLKGTPRRPVRPACTTGSVTPPRFWN